MPQLSIGYFERLEAIEVALVNFRHHMDIGNYEAARRDLKTITHNSLIIEGWVTHKIKAGDPDAA